MKISLFLIALLVQLVAGNTTTTPTTTSAPTTTLSPNITVKTTAWSSKFNNTGIIGEINRTDVVHSLVHCTALCARTNCNAFTFKEVEGKKNCSLYQIEVNKENLIVEDGSTVYASAFHFCTSDIVGLHPVFCTNGRSCIKNRCRCKGATEDEFGCYNIIYFQRLYNPEPRLLEWFNLYTDQLKTPYTFRNLSIPQNCAPAMNCTIVFATPQPWNLLRTSNYGYWPSPVPLNIGPTITIMYCIDEQLHVYFSEFDNVTEEIGAVPINIKDEFEVICDGENLTVQVGNISITSPELRKLYCGNKTMWFSLRHDDLTNKAIGLRLRGLIYRQHTRMPPSNRPPNNFLGSRLHDLPNMTFEFEVSNQTRWFSLPFCLGNRWVSTGQRGFMFLFMMSTNVSEVSGSGVTIFILNSKAKTPLDSSSYIQIDFQRNATHSEITMKLKAQHVFTVTEETNQILNSTNGTETFKRYKAEYWFLLLSTDNSSCSVELEAGFMLTSELEVVFNFTRNFTFFNEIGSDCVNFDVWPDMERIGFRELIHQDPAMDADGLMEAGVDKSIIRLENMVIEEIVPSIKPWYFEGRCAYPNWYLSTP